MYVVKDSIINNNNSYIALYKKMYVVKDSIINNNNSYITLYPVRIYNYASILPFVSLLLLQENVCG